MFHTPDSHASFLFVELLKNAMLFLPHFSDKHYYNNNTFIPIQTIRSINEMDMYSTFAIYAISAFYNKNLREFQFNIIHHLVNMMSGTIPKKPILMV